MYIRNFIYVYIHNVLAGEDFTPGSYNATFISGATSATGSIPILFNNTDDEDKQFCLRFYIDGAVYGLGLQKGSNTRATVTISTRKHLAKLHAHVCFKG